MPNPAPDRSSGPNSGPGRPKIPFSTRRRIGNGRKGIERAGDRSGGDSRGHQDLGGDRNAEPRRRRGQQAGRRGRGVDAGARRRDRARSGPRRLRRYPEGQDQLGPSRGSAGYSRALPPRHRPSHGADRRGPAVETRRRPRPGTRHLRHEGGRAYGLLRLPASGPAGKIVQASDHLPVCPGGGSRQPDLAGDDRGRGEEA